MTTIPDHLIDKAARAFQRLTCRYPLFEWEDTPAHVQDMLREDASAILDAVADDLRAEGARAALNELAVWLRVPGVSGPLVTEQDVIAFAHHHYPEETGR